MRAQEANFDGLCGPTHHYGGLAWGNLASGRSSGQVANPRLAAQQGLDKMWLLARLGLPQGVLPPHERPDMFVLRRLGFAGSDQTVIAAAAQAAPALLSACSSAAPMWVANAATVSPSADTADGRVHFTPANLICNLHRAFEHRQTTRILQAVFPDPAHFCLHPPLPAHPAFGDEGAANHSRLDGHAGEAGVELFVYGRQAMATGPAPTRFPARQTREASEAVARLHGLHPQRIVFAQQHPAAIEAGVFHNDVIAVAHRDLLLVHQQAWLDQPRVLQQLCDGLGPVPLQVIEIAGKHINLADAVASYLFNSQLLTLRDGRTLLLAAAECQETPAVADWLAQQAQQGEWLDAVQYVDLRQSMRNGGGPACLRLRVVLAGTEQIAVNPAVWLDEPLYLHLSDWIARHYRDRLSAADLADPHLLTESRQALDELTRILRLGSIYPFQCEDIHAD